MGIKHHSIHHACLLLLSSVFFCLGGKKWDTKVNKKASEKLLLLKLLVFVSLKSRDYLFSIDGQLHPEVRQEIWNIKWSDQAYKQGDSSNNNLENGGVWMVQTQGSITKPGCIFILLGLGGPQFFSLYMHTCNSPQYTIINPHIIIFLSHLSKYY